MRRNRSLIFDPRSEDSSNAPLTIFTEPGRGPGVYVTDHKYPDPEQEVLAAGGREGKKRLGPPILGNRQIPIEVFVMGRRESYAAQLVNLATNPIAALASTSWAGVSLAGGPTRISVDTSPIAADTAVEALTNAAGDYVYFPIAVTNAKTYRASIYVQLAALTATGVRIVVYNAAGAAKKAEGVTYKVVDLSADGWARLDVTFVADATATWRVGVEQVGAGAATIRSTGLLVEESAELHDYFDGDSPGSTWTGIPHGSTTTQPADADAHFEAMLGDLEEKLTKLREKGGTYSRPYQAGRLVFDVEGLVGGEDGGYDGRRWVQRGQKLAWTLEAKPHGRGEQQTREIRSQTTDPVCVFTESLIPGSVRALGELEIADAAAIARRGCVAAVEVPDYDYTAATAALYYQAEVLTPMGSSTLAAATGAVGAGNNTIQTVLSEAWQALASTKIAASGLHLTHVGVFRIFARIRMNAGASPPAGSELRYRLEWGQGDLIERVTNDPARIVARSVADYYIVDLGLVRVRKAKVGTQRWEGQIVGASYDPAGAGTFKPTSNIDDLRIVPVSTAYLKAHAAKTKLESPTSVTNRDLFNQAAGALNGKTAESGGVWATVNGDGAGVQDFAVGTPSAAQAGRSIQVGLRLGVLPTVIAGSVFHKATVAGIGQFAGADFRTGLMVRYVDASNYAALIFEGKIATNLSLSLIKVVAGVRTTLATKTLATGWYLAWGDLGVFVGTSGYCEAYFITPGGLAVGFPLGEPALTAYDSALGPGGSLASGKAGIYDYWSTANLNNCGFDYVETWTPAESTLIASGRRLRWRHDSVQREDAAGGGLWSEIGYEGDPLLIPPSTKEQRVARVIAFPTRGDLDVVPDSGNSDDFTAQLALTARHVNVRG